MLMHKHSRRVAISRFNSRSWVLFPVRVGMFLLALALTTTTVISDENEPRRSWTSRDGQSIEASLVSFDDEKRLATLEKNDDTLMEIPLNSFSRRDQRFIKSWLRKKRDENPESPSGSDGAGNSHPDAVQPDKQVRSTRRKSPDRGLQDTRLLYGIHWQKNGPAALAAAQGQPGLHDDRPIMWFRVLGDLEGFM